MNPRERFQASMSYGSFDQFMWHEDVPDEIAVKWMAEGLPLKDALLAFMFKGSIFFLFFLSLCYGCNRYM